MYEWRRTHMWECDEGSKFEESGQLEGVLTTTTCDWKDVWAACRIIAYAFEDESYLWYLWQNVDSVLVHLSASSIDITLDSYADDGRTWKQVMRYSSQSTRQAVPLRMRGEEGRCGCNHTRHVPSRTSHIFDKMSIALLSIYRISLDSYVDDGRAWKQVMRYILRIDTSQSTRHTVPLRMRGEEGKCGCANS